MKVEKDPDSMALQEIMQPEFANAQQAVDWLLKGYKVDDIVLALRMRSPELQEQAKVFQEYQNTLAAEASLQNKDTEMAQKYAAKDLRDCIHSLPPQSNDLARRMMTDLDVLEGNVVSSEMQLDTSSLQQKTHEPAIRQTNGVEKQDPGATSSADPYDNLEGEEDGAFLQVEIDEDADSETEKAVQSLDKQRADSKTSNAGSNLPILQFATSTFFATEGEDPDMVLDIMRIGDDSKACSCEYATQDLSAKAGHKYTATSGKVDFPPGTHVVSIRVPILDDDHWDATLEFMVVLSEPVGCQLGRKLFRTRVKIIDNDCFPSNRFGERIQKAATEKTSQHADFGLMLEYFIMNLRNPIVKLATKKLIFYGQIGNLYFIFTLILTKQLIDKILGECEGGGKVLGMFDCPGKDDPDSAVGLLVLFMFLYIIPFSGLHYFEYRRNFWKIGGASRKTLQANLLRKFLNYSEDSRASIKNSDLMMGMNRDSFDLVSNGFMQIFPLIWNSTRLLFIIILQLTMPTKTAMIPVLVFPVILFTYLKLRTAKTQTVQVLKDESQNKLLGHVETVARNFRIIADYAMRPTAVDEFEHFIGDFNGKNATASAVRVNNAFLAPWLSTLFVGLWFVIGGKKVADPSDDATLGSFLTTLGIFKEVGSSWSSIYGIILSVQSALVPLGKITTFMNLATDLGDRKHMNAKRKQMSETMDHQARQLAKKTGAYAADLIPIKLENVSYTHGQTELTLRSLKNCNAEFDQGSLVAIVGQASHGKSTMLKLIGGVLFPHTGVVAIPPHLRVLHISPFPVFFEGTLLKNLTYGLKATEADSGRDRVLNICKHMKMSEHLHHLLDEDESDDISTIWSETLSLTTQSQLNLARALVNNPNVLVLHKPTLYLTDDLATAAFQALRKFVDERGLEQDPQSFNHRRSRTVIMTTSRLYGLSAADAIYEVTEQGDHHCINKLPKVGVSEAMLA